MKLKSKTFIWYAAHLLRSLGFETALAALAKYRKWMITDAKGERRNFIL